MFFQAIRSKQISVKRATSPDKMDSIVQKALKPLAKDIAEENRDQLRIGMKSDGSFLPNYSSVSITKFGKKPGKIKLRDTGDFYEGIKPDFAKTGFTLDSTDWKNEKLKADYGDEILGLSDYGLKEISRDAIGQIQYELRKEIDK